MAPSRAHANDLDDRRLSNRRVNEFIGICRAFAADAQFSEEDARTLDKWLSANKQLEDFPLVEQVSEAVDEAFADGFGKTSLGELFDSVQRLVGGTDIGSPLPTTLPLDNPLPELFFEDARYCFTGRFKFGTRRECEEAVRQLGATAGAIATSTDFLVIGSSISETWNHSSYGTKISQAVRWRNEGHPVSIVSEAHWVDSLTTPRATRRNARPAATTAKKQPARLPIDVWKEQLDRGEISEEEFLRQFTTYADSTEGQGQLAHVIRFSAAPPRAATAGAAPMAAVLRNARRASRAPMQFGAPWILWPILMFFLSFLTVWMLD